MLPLLGLRKNNIVGFLISPTQLLCSWVVPSKNAFSLQAFKKIALTLSNISLVSDHMKNFLHTHKLKNAYAVLALSGDSIVEKKIALPNPPISAEQLELPEFASLIWDYQTDPDTNSVYACGIKREHLAQYQLMCIHSKLNCVAITSEQAIRNLMHTASARLNSKFDNTDDEKLLCLGMYYTGNTI